MRARWWVGLSLVGVLAGLSGCGDADGPPPRTGVRGTVTLDGAPMAEGQILFLDAGGEGAPAFLDVKDGRFEGDVPHGKKKVQILSFKKGKLKTGEEDPVGVQVVHPNYNRNSKLTTEVTGSGATPSEFNVQSAR
ncbi:hypothetical protein R5W24_003625 [Gemmata sp. JC717]|uniref:hypothetical protein n=1 Tax=Gemmata algarum TaxID=2975278 RepID=UPI0021BB3FA5|nr:hypothetical protein [Gemmata algarum]MDY3554501.1 hypothetical protein [Gemmata algarum]